MKELRRGPQFTLPTVMTRVVLIPTPDHIGLHMTNPIPPTLSERYLPMPDTHDETQNSDNPDDPPLEHMQKILLGPVRPDRCQTDHLNAFQL
jgi:hypothetical protein